MKDNNYTSRELGFTAWLHQNKKVSYQIGRDNVGRKAIELLGVAEENAMQWKAEYMQTDECRHDELIKQMRELVR